MAFVEKKNKLVLQWAVHKKLIKVDFEILHIAPDEKFIDMAYAQFERVLPGRNTWLINSNKSELRYVKASVDMVGSVYKLVDYVRKSGCKALIFHSLPDSWLPIIDKMHGGVRIAWLGWGYDYYERLLIAGYPEGLLLPMTCKVKDSAPVIHLSRTMRAYSVAKKMTRRALGYDVQFNFKTINKINYFSPVIDAEYSLACSLNSQFQPKYLPWNYGTVEDDFGWDGATGDLGDDLLVGNSATYENNHVDLFRYIADRYVLSNRMLVAPLSYGSDFYRTRVLEAGKYYFGSSFLPLVDFMDKASYTSLLDRCGYVFMGHLRQQALGNICIMMMKGARIHLHSRNPLYQWFLKRGAFVDAWDVRSDSLCELTRLAIEQRVVNQSVIVSNWGRAVQHEKTKVLVNALICS